jgi:hypothetical protein
MIDFILKYVSFKSILGYFKDKLLSMNKVDAAQWTVRRVVEFTETKKDDAIWKIVDPRVDAIQDYLRDHKEDSTPNKLRFTGEQIKEIGQAIIDNADQF